jgi:KaiC/GvpD/RAD55 family RecA-like ATPase
MNVREAGMMCVTGIQGVGKTYLNQHVIYDYCRDKLSIKVRARKCLIFDTNGEYTKDQFEKNGMSGFDAKVIKMSDIISWSRNPIVECRRIDAKTLTIAEKREAIEHIMRYFKNGMLVLEDVNTYILNVTHMEKIVSGLVSLRHRAVDVLISYQSLRPVEPRIWQNSRWVRMHFQADNVNDIKGKVSNPTMFKIAQYIVNNRYFNNDERFYVYIHNFSNKIEGDFTKEEFEQACVNYVNANKKYLKEHREMTNCTEEEAKQSLVRQYVKLYYGNEH